MMTLHPKQLCAYPKQNKLVFRFRYSQGISISGITGSPSSSHEQRPSCVTAVVTSSKIVRLCVVRSTCDWF